MTTRRDFIKNTCTACFGVAITGAFLESCANLPVYKTSVKDDTIIVPLSTILPEEKSKIIRTDQFDYDILLVRNENGNNQALLMKCTHLDNGLVVNKNGLSCNLHGSRFDLNGEVTNGPATQQLKKYRITETNTELIIHLK